MVESLRSLSIVRVIFSFSRDVRFDWDDVNFSRRSWISERCEFTWSFNLLFSKLRWEEIICSFSKDVLDEESWDVRSEICFLKLADSILLAYTISVISREWFSLSELSSSDLDYSAASNSSWCFYLTSSMTLVFSSLSIFKLSLISNMA